jgi:hypothetical protein
VRRGAVARKCSARHPAQPAHRVLTVVRGGVRRGDEALQLRPPVPVQGDQVLSAPVPAPQVETAGHPDLVTATIDRLAAVPQR